MLLNVFNLCFGCKKSAGLLRLLNFFLVFTILHAWTTINNNNNIKTGMRPWSSSFVSINNRRVPQISTILKMIPSNQELVEERLRIGLEKKENRLRSKQNKHNRHMEIKRLLHTNTTNYTVPDLYAVKISVCKELREDLKLNAREKRGRFFLEKGGEATTLRGLKKELHEFFRALKKVRTV